MKWSLIDNWRDWKKLWSTRLGAFGLILLSFLEVFPDAAITVWSVLPSDIRTEFPVDFIRWVGYVIILTGLIARYIKQPKLHDSVGPEGQSDIQE